MVDLVKIFITAGKGGDGRISFLRNRRTMKGGPDGGDGGNGGSVIAVTTVHENTLRDFSGLSKIEAINGQNGGAEKMHGKDQEDTLIKLPIGTRIWRVVATHQPNEPKRMYRVDRDLGRVERPIERRASSTIKEEGGVFELIEDDRKEIEAMQQKLPQAKLGDIVSFTYGGMAYESQLVGDLTKEGQEVLIARGGRGGKGNETYKSSRLTTPMEAQTGEGAESGEFFFELQLLADVGLVGFPNAGKSTLLSVLTKATPKIANYPFTTLEPNLGVMRIENAGEDERHTLVIADLPGLIEGASEGKGLGHEFLRHVSRCKVLVFLLSIDDGILLQDPMDLESIVEQYQEAYKTLENELVTYEKEASNSSIPFSKKKKIIVLSKADLVPDEKQEQILRKVQKDIKDIFWISAATGQGLEQLRKELLSLI
ncbi:MAG: GTPase [Candidatus Woesebacteria bacterium]